MNDPGTYLELDGRPAVRFVRTYPHSIDTVWAAITEPAQSALWFPSIMTIEPRVGGLVSFTGDPHMPDSTGSVLAYDPPRELAFSWGADEMHLGLVASGGGCVLTLINVLEHRSAAARNASGWHVCLHQLDRLVSGTVAGGPHATDAQDWRPIYDAYVAAGLPSGAEIPT
jgi:uncharacterized protein YndB with AHSA1/START domain